MHSSRTQLGIDHHHRSPMYARRPQGVIPVAIALPPQPLQNRRSSLLSAAPSPTTPCVSPKWSPICFSSAANRNSTDSWNSSNGPDEIEWEWKPEQVLLLTRTLDALPAHLVTPFIGPVPPSNLLDKIARGVSHAKGPVDWPHSVRATRVKLLELAKKRAKEESLQHFDDSDRENFDAEFQSSRAGSEAKRSNIRRPLYRQNSMDFMNVAGPHLDENNITRLANRLQRTDKSGPPSIYHPYTRKPRPQSSTDRFSPCASFMNPSTPSSSTLTSVASWTSSVSTHPNPLRRSASSTSSTTTSSMSVSSSNNVPVGTPSEHDLRRVKLMEADFAPPLPPKGTKLGSKRAPSYGALVQGVKHEKEMGTSLHHERRNSTSSCPSSDEEEKTRSERVKKQRTRPSLVSTPVKRPKEFLPPISKPLPSTPVPQRSFIRSVGNMISGAPCDVATDKSDTSKKVASPTTQRRKLPMNLQRNPSILGGELPKHTQIQRSPIQPATPTIEAPPRHHSPPDSPSPQSFPSSPSSAQAYRKTLRRVKRLAPGRRISFGGSGDGITDNDSTNVDAKGNERSCLGSAFQMH